MSQHEARAGSARFFPTKAEMQGTALSLDGKRGPSISLSSETSPHCRLQSVKKKAVAGRLSFLTLRDPSLKSRRALFYDGHLIDNTESLSYSISMPELVDCGKDFCFERVGRMPRALQAAIRFP
jgi:hypothetical protein